MTEKHPGTHGTRWHAFTFSPFLYVFLPLHRVQEKKIACQCVSTRVTGRELVRKPLAVVAVGQNSIARKKTRRQVSDVARQRQTLLFSGTLAVI
jgi:hypothetical protein